MVVKTVVESLNGLILDNYIINPSSFSTTGFYMVNLNDINASLLDMRSDLGFFAPDLYCKVSFTVLSIHDSLNLTEQDLHIIKDKITNKHPEFCITSRFQDVGDDGQPLEGSDHFDYDLDGKDIKEFFRVGLNEIDDSKRDLGEILVHDGILLRHVFYPCDTSFKVKDGKLLMECDFIDSSLVDAVNKGGATSHVLLQFDDPSKIDPTSGDSVSLDLNGLIAAKIYFTARPSLMNINTVSAFYCESKEDFEMVTVRKKDTRFKHGKMEE